MANNLTTTSSGYALDARQGKELQNQITTLNTNFITTVTDITGGGNGYFYLPKNQNGYILFSVIATKQTDVAVESICVAGDYYTLRCNAPLVSGKIYEFALLWIKIGINA